MRPTGKRRRRCGRGKWRRLFLLPPLHLHLVDKVSQELSPMSAHLPAPLDFFWRVDVLLLHLFPGKVNETRDLAGVCTRIGVAEGVRFIRALEVIEHEPQEGFGTRCRRQIDGEKQIEEFERSIEMGMRETLHTSSAIVTSPRGQ